MCIRDSNVYDLIVRRFIAAFYPDCAFATTTVTGAVDKIDFKVSGKEILAPGWRQVYARDTHKDDEAEKDDEERTLEAFVKGEEGPHTPTLTEKQTTPPKPYTCLLYTSGFGHLHHPPLYELTLLSGVTAVDDAVGLGHEFLDDCKLLFDALVVYELDAESWRNHG